MKTTTTETSADSSNSIGRDLLIVVLAFTCFWLVGGIGAALLAHACTPRSFITDDSVFLEQMEIVYWVAWGAKVIGRFSGDLICGVLLGRCLNRFNSWRMFAIVASFPLIIILMNRGLMHVDNGRWVESVGVGGAVLQIVLQICAMLGTVALGVWFGRRWKLQIASKVGPVPPAA